VNHHTFALARFFSKLLELLKALIDVPDGRLVALDSVSQNVPATLQFSLKVSPFLGTQFLYIEMRYHKSTHC
jgi:hypothetical protein